MLPNSSPHFLQGVVQNSWVPVCRPTDVRKGEITTVRVLDNSFGVTKGSSGEIQVFEDVCPHRSAKLSPGSVKNGCVTCPYHGIEFDTESGNVSKFVEGYPLKKLSGMVLNKMDIEVHDNVVWIRPQGIETPDSQFYEEMDPTEFVSVYGSCDVDCSMFEVEENLIDCAHITSVHSWGNPASLPSSVIRSEKERGVYFLYKYGKNSIASFMNSVDRQSDHPVGFLTVFSSFKEPFSSMTRVCFGLGLTKVVRVHLLPLSENKTRMFWGIHRNFAKTTLLDGLFRYFMEKTIDEDKTILENLPQKPTKQVFFEFDWLVLQYRKKLSEFLDV